MSLYGRFKTNENRETQGIEVELHEAPNDDGSIPTFIVSRMGGSNKAYTRTLEKMTKPLRRQSDMGLLGEEVLRPIVRKAFCEAVLKGWRNVFDENGKPVPYSLEAATKLMEDLPALYDILSSEASTLSNFRDKAIETESGKS